MIASSGDDGKVNLTFVPKAQVIETLAEDQSAIPIYSAAFSSFSQYIAAGSADGMVKVWNLKSRSLQVKSHSHNELVYSVVWNLNDSVLASGSMNGQIALHTIDKQSSISTLNSISHVRFVLELGNTTIALLTFQTGSTGECMRRRNSGGMGRAAARTVPRVCEGARHELHKRGLQPREP